MQSTDVTNSETKRRKDLAAGLRVTWIGMGGNVLLVIIKIWVGLYSRSQALVADGIHSLSDLFSDVVVIFGLKLGRMEEDENHPFGHARIETAASMLVGIILFLVGLGIGYNAVSSIYHHDESHPGLPAILAALFSILLKEGLYWYTVGVGKRIKSPALIGNAWHHRSDAFSSIAVLIGVGGAYLNPSWHMADAYAALIVTFFIIKVGGNLTWSAMKEVVDTAPDQKMQELIERTALGIHGVREVHDIRARHSGAQIFVELHIVVDPFLTVWDGHEIAATVKHTMLNSINDVTRVIIHVDPVLKKPAQ
jgi:cation diffusion facilitator family transporter